MTRPVDIALLNFPLDVFVEAQEHSDELLREFQFIASSRESDAQHSALPKRLSALVDELVRRYGTEASEAEELRDAAIDRGERRMDLHFSIPYTGVRMFTHLGEVLDEADEYCRAGEHLLTLSTPPRALAFRHWYMGELARQLEGGAPSPWPEASDVAGCESR